jgi:hypothetical protein
VNLSYSAEYEQFRAEVRASSPEAWTAADVASLPDPDAMSNMLGGGRPSERVTEFRKQAIERGYLYRHVPRR